MTSRNSTFTGTSGILAAPNGQGDDFFGLLEEAGLLISPEKKRRIQDRLAERFSYEPKIGVFGKTGAGKSSLCNALFGKDVCAVSNIEACTRDPQEVLLNIDAQGLKLIDVPGVGESAERDAEYGALYETLLPELDAVFWVLKGDDRAYSQDQEVFHRLVKPYLDAGKPFFIVLNQVDKLEPFREWDEAGHRPGPRQSETIQQKVEVVARIFGLPASKVIPVSASERYNLVTVIDELVFALPPEQKVIVLRETPKENTSEASRTAAEKGFWQIVDEAIEEVLPEVAKVAYRALKGAVRSAWDWLVS